MIQFLDILHSLHFPGLWAAVALMCQSMVLANDLESDEPINYNTTDKDLPDSVDASHASNDLIRDYMFREDIIMLEGRMGADPTGHGQNEMYPGWNSQRLSSSQREFVFARS